MTVITLLSDCSVVLYKPTLFLRNDVANLKGNLPQLRSKGHQSKPTSPIKASNQCPTSNGEFNLMVMVCDANDFFYIVSNAFLIHFDRIMSLHGKLHYPHTNCIMTTTWDSLRIMSSGFRTVIVAWSVSGLIELNVNIYYLKMSGLVRLFGIIPS